MSRSHPVLETKGAFRRRQSSPAGRFLMVNAAALVLHLTLALVAKTQLAAEVMGPMTVGVLLLVGHGVLLLWTAHLYTSAVVSADRGQA
jgi:hypothetical protein